MTGTVAGRRPPGFRRTAPAAGAPPGRPAWTAVEAARLREPCLDAAGTDGAWLRPAIGLLTREPVAAADRETTALRSVTGACLLLEVLSADQERLEGWVLDERLLPPDAHGPVQLCRGSASMGEFRVPAPDEWTGQVLELAQDLGVLPALSILVPEPSAGERAAPASPGTWLVHGPHGATLTVRIA